MKKRGRKKYAVIFLILLAVGMAAGVIFWQKQKEELRLEREAAGKEEVPESDSEYDGELTDDIRLHNYSYIRLTDKIEKGDYVDIRISFANGADFVLLSKKKVADIRYGQEENGVLSTLWMYVSEEEILRLSSAAVDAYINEGCSIYAIRYAKASQKQAYVNYPVNEVVRQLMDSDPNIVKKAENVQEWKLWKELSQEGNTIGTEEIEDDGTSTEAVSLNQDAFEDGMAADEEEIIYFD